MAAMPTIDLGDPGEERERDAARPHLPPRLRRMLMGAALALVAFATLTAAQPPRPSWIEPLWTAELRNGARFAIGSQNVYLTLPDAGILARDLRTGALRWRRAGSGPGLGAFDLGGGVAGVYGFIGPGEGGGVALTFVDDATGSVLGAADGTLVGVTDAGRVLVAAPGRFACPPCTDVSSHNPRTGSFWRGVLPGRLIVSLPRGPATAVQRFALASEDGSVTLYEAETGDAVARVVLPLRAGVLDSDLTLVGDTLVEIVRGQIPFEMVAYGFDPPRRLWSMVVPSRGPRGVENGSGRLFLSDCGQVHCLHLDEYNLIIDVATGRLQATVDADVVGQLGGGRLLAISPRGSTLGAGLHVLDPSDGRPLTSFADSEPVQWVDSDGRALLRQRGPAGEAFTLLDAAGNARRLGVVAVPPGSLCQAQGDVLACSVVGRELVVWRMLL